MVILKTQVPQNNSGPPVAENKFQTICDAPKRLVFLFGQTSDDFSDLRKNRELFPSPVPSHFSTVRDVGQNAYVGLSRSAQRDYVFGQKATS